MENKLFVTIVLLMSIKILIPLNTFSWDGKNNNGNMQSKVSQTKNVTRFNINNISTFIQGDGISDVRGNNPGFFYPTLSKKTANFQSGFVWGGYVGDSLRIGGSTYFTSLTPGKILDDGTAENPSDDKVRIFRVRRDYRTSLLSVEAQDEASTEDAIRAQYEKDWTEWPANRGAPFEYGKDATGVQRTSGPYNPNYDIPGVPGADQTIWWVANDLNTAAASHFYGSVPMGVELQCTVWGYHANDALGNMFFKKYIIINKNKDHRDFTKFYVNYWDDVDIGGGAFDFNGCDTTLSLGYIYCGVANNVQYGFIPPAVGINFLQGPKIRTCNGQDTAIFKGKKFSGYKNLPMTTYYIFGKGNSDPTYGEPDPNSAIGISPFYNLMQGLISSTGQPFIDPTTSKATKFLVSGDPITKTGWIDDRPPSDRRMGLASGPFTLAYGDTQEVVFAEIAAGAIPGVDRLGAVQLLKQYASIAKLYYNDLNNITTDVQEKEILPTEFLLSQNFPNPFNPTTTINYHVPVAENVLLKVYDVLGREVATLVNEKKQPGSYEVKFEGNGLPSGVYFYRMSAGKFSQTKKIVLLK